MKIILASQSPRRKELLALADISFDVIVKETDETYPENLSSEEIAIHIAVNKGKAVKVLHGDDLPILSADTIVVHQNKIIGKPKDRLHAIEILSNLSGQKHLVITGVCILYKGNELCFSDTTEVTFHHLSQEQISFYVDTFKPFDKAGAYAIQEWIGLVGIKSINGDFYNVMGLPVSNVIKALHQLNCL